MSIRLYVGNLPKESFEREKLAEIFAGSVDQSSIRVITDRKTGKCRGFAFVTVPTDELADQIIAAHNNQDFLDTKLKIEKAMPRKSGEEETGGDRRSSSAPAGSNRRASGGGGRRNTSSTTTTTTNSTASTQPDPRWAGELAKLREMLAAQTTQS
jgi:RNA recognition motif-containing protein